ncbi:Uncharacterised protein [Mycobacteroides abscessus subsp. abscessus]|nr:Uncharacterised protein [Mycobacteroides abscessus subsp. abscessus]
MDIARLRPTPTTKSLVHSCARATSDPSLFPQPSASRRAAGPSKAIASANSQDAMSALCPCASPHGL